MILNKLMIVNYRSCQKLAIEFDSDEPNIFIGLNDSGKSSILNSIDLLLSDKPNYNFLSEGKYKSDLSNSPIEIEEFDLFLKEHNLPKFPFVSAQTIIIGKLIYSDIELEKFKTLELSNTLSWALEKSLTNEIWIAKTYSSLGNQFLIFTEDVNENLRLWELGSTDLNKHLKENGITATDIQNENGIGRFSNMEKIRAAYKTKVLESKWNSYRFGKSDKDVFPEFKYFDWNCSFDDINAIANAIMKEHIDNQLTPLKQKALLAADEAEKEINKKFNELTKTIQSVAKGVENVTSKVHFDVKEKISDIMVQKINSDGFVHLESQGEGLKRQIWFSLIKSKAENNTQEGVKQFIWAFDEPETHLFPGAQRELFDTLCLISNGNVQTIISTHSTVFIDKSRIDKISSVSQNGTGYTELNYCTDVDSIYSSLSVRNSDFLFYDKFLIVEGDTEQHLIPKLFELYTNKTLIDQNIQLININGKDKWDLNKAIIDKVMTGFKKSNETMVYLFDNDMSFQIGQSARLANMFFVGKQDIEDSIESEIWMNLINNNYSERFSITINEIENLKETVEEGGKCASHDKFYPKLIKLLKKKWIESNHDKDLFESIPSKGNESAEFILRELTTKEQIPTTIIQAFNKLLN
jgi:putative ATP-dependent endonuclease of the OLD family